MRRQTDLAHRSSIALSCQRTHARQPMRRPITVQLVGDVTWFHVVARDVSAGGLGFSSTSALAPGDQLWVIVEEGASPRSATVRHAVPSGSFHDIGVAFDETLPADVLTVLGA